MVIFTDNASANLESDAKDQKNKLETFYGTTVSRKVGKAVLRNKLKRWVRNSAKIDVWPKRLCGKRSVFIFRPQGKEFYEKITFSDFKAALENLR